MIQGCGLTAGLKSDQFNRKRKFEKANPPKADKYRIMNVECRSDVFCLFKKRLSAATPSFRIPHSDFRIRQM
jgi:hypothetical protein